MTGPRRPVAFDVTHLVTRLDRAALTGIDQVDLAYARHFARSSQLVCGVHYGLIKPHRFAPDRVRDTLVRLERKRAMAAPSQDWPSLRSWIVGETPETQGVKAAKPPLQWGDFVHKWKLRVTMDGAFDPPVGAIYLNVAQHAFEFPRYFRWLDTRPDLMSTFLVHDLLPLDLPEFFRAGYEARFERRLSTILRHARALITTSHVVRDRIVVEYAKRGRTPVPILVQPLASPLETNAADSVDESLSREPYFVVVSTIEPRKNHLMLLHVWRQFAARRAKPPKLVIVGVPGWGCDETLAVLERCPSLRRCVNHVSGLPDGDLRKLIANARALLMPSFAEGYGLPIVESLTLGTPVIASDIPVFREVSQGLATFLSPLNGDAWMEEVLRHRGPPNQRRAVNSSAFMTPNWDDYFGEVEAFLWQMTATREN